MTWVAVGVGAATVIGGAYSANKAEKSQSKAAKNALASSQQAAGAIAPWAARGSSAADELQALLGLGYNDSEQDLINKYMGEYTTTVKKKKKKGLKRAIELKDQNSVGGTLFGRDGKSAPGTVTDWNALNARVKSEMEKQKAVRERGDFGMLRKDFTNEDFVKDPGYNFRLEEGNKGVQSSLAARGGLFSGQAGKELNRYNQGFASNEFGAAADRYNRNRTNIYNMLSGQAIQGQNASAGVATQMNNIGANQLNLGNIQAAGDMARGNALTGALQSGFNYWQSANAMNPSQKKPNQLGNAMAGAPYQGSGMYS